VRLSNYLAAMFPLPVMLPAALVSFLAVHWGLQAMTEPSILPGSVAVTGRVLLGALSLGLFQLLLRVYDELKDAETDIALGKAGDPRYKDRPIVTGHVTVADLDALRAYVTWGLVVLNLLLGVDVFLAFLGAFALCWLSGKWFFWPAVSRNLLLAFATHNPLTLVLGLYVVAIFASEFTYRAPLDGWVALLLLGLYLPVAAWEVGRKVRLPEEETDYQTYSKWFGWRLAAAIPGVCVIGSAVCLTAVLWHLEMRWSPLLIWAAALLPLAAIGQLLLDPRPGRTQLKPVLELFLLAVNGGMTLLWGVTHGLRWGA
jgi:hypothetical protein